MKAVIICLMCFYIGISRGFCQSQERINIPVLAEHSDIDTLLKVALNPYTHAGKRALNQASKDSCLLVYVLANRSDFLFAVDTYDKDDINRSVNASIQIKRNIGYFRYKNLNVFVCSDDAFHKFFSRTAAQKSFSFITKTDTSTVDHLKHSLIGYSYSYLSRNGGFVPDDPALRVH